MNESPRWPCICQAAGDLLSYPPERAERYLRIVPQEVRPLCFPGESAILHNMKNTTKRTMANKTLYIKPADKMILFLVFIMFIVLIVGVKIGTQGYREKQLAAVQDSMEILADMQKTQFEQYISDKISVLQALATFPEIYEMDPVRQEELMKGRSNALGFHHLFIIREDGIGFYIEENTTRDQKDEPFYKNVMEYDIYITEPFYGADAATMTISVSIRDKDGNKTGALCGAINLTEIQQMFRRNRMLMDGISYLINRDGTYIAATDMKKVYSKGIIYEEENTDAALIREAFAEYGDVTGTMIQDGVEYLTNITYLKDYDWVIVQGIRKEEIFRDIRYVDYWGNIALVIVVVIILCVARIVFYWRSNSRRINTDTLTGCGSRAAMQSLTERLEHIYKYDITVVYFDLNHFKQANDNYGHENGDKILRIFAETLMKVFSGRGQVGRIGGDEFMVILLDIPETETQKLCRQMEERLAEQSSALGIPYTISTSYGYATRPKDCKKPLNDTITLADKNMYLFKESHR